MERRLAGSAGGIIQQELPRQQAAHVDAALGAGQSDQSTHRIHETFSIVIEPFMPCRIDTLGEAWRRTGHHYRSSYRNGAGMLQQKNISPTKGTPQKQFPLNLFGIPFGLSGLAGTWTAASTAVGMNAAVADALWMIAALSWL